MLDEKDSVLTKALNAAGLLPYREIDPIAAGCSGDSHLFEIYVIKIELQA